MANLSRREFITRTMGTVAAVTAAPAAFSAEFYSGTSMRVLGKTGIELTLLGMGLGVRAGNEESELTRKGHDTAIEVILSAYDKGIRYYDMSKSYGAHPFLKEAMQKGVDRDKVTLLTKSGSRTPDKLKQDVDDFRTELGTDVIDIFLMHCMTEEDWPVKYAACLDVLEEAKAKGKIRAHGVSCHSLPALKAAAECPWVEVMLGRINPYGILMDGKPEDVVPVMRKAHDAGKGVLGMKILGEGRCADRIGQSIKWVLELGIVDAMPIGFLAPDEIDGALAHIRAVEKA